MIEFLALVHVHTTGQGNQFGMEGFASLGAQAVRPLGIIHPDPVCLGNPYGDVARLVQSLTGIETQRLPPLLFA